MFGVYDFFWTFIIYNHENIFLTTFQGYNLTHNRTSISSLRTIHLPSQTLMNVRPTLTTAHLMLTVRMWMELSSVRVKWDLQEMEKHAMVSLNNMAFNK